MRGGHLRGDGGSQEPCGSRTATRTCLMGSIPAGLFRPTRRHAASRRPRDEVGGGITERAVRDDVARALQGLEDAARPTVVTDGDRVLQIITNLLSNAFRWTPDGGRVAYAGPAADDAPFVLLPDMPAPETADTRAGPLAAPEPVTVPALQPITASRAWFDAVDANPFHGGLLSGLRDYA